MIQFNEEKYNEREKNKTVKRNYTLLHQRSIKRRRMLLLVRKKRSGSTDSTKMLNLERRSLQKQLKRRQKSLIILSHLTLTSQRIRPTTDSHLDPDFNSYMQMVRRNERRDMLKLNKGDLRLFDSGKKMSVLCRKNRKRIPNKEKNDRDQK